MWEKSTLGIFISFRGMNEGKTVAPVPSLVFKERKFTIIIISGSGNGYGTSNGVCVV